MTLGNNDGKDSEDTNKGDQVIIWNWKDVCIVSKIILTNDPQLSLTPQQEARF